LGGDKVSAILKNYTVSYKFWNHGMADLILWNVKTNKIKFSEVKSTNDRLSETQKAWLQYMQENNIDCEICLVNWEIT